MSVFTISASSIPQRFTETWSVIAIDEGDNVTFECRKVPKSYVIAIRGIRNGAVIPLASVKLVASKTSLEGYDLPFQARENKKSWRAAEKAVKSVLPYAVHLLIEL